MASFVKSFWKTLFSNPKLSETRFYVLYSKIQGDYLFGKTVCNRFSMPALLALWLYFPLISVLYPGCSALLFTSSLFRDP